MRRFFLFVVFFFVLAISYQLSAIPVFAQSTCDLCGYCQGTTPPANWNSCAQCIYAGTSSPDDALLITPNPNKSYTVFGCVSTDAGGFASFFMNFITSAVSAVAFLGILYGGFQVMIARGDPDKMNEGKRYIYGAILGLLIVLFSVFIVKTIGGTILQIPYLR